MGKRKLRRGPSKSSPSDPSGDSASGSATTSSGIGVSSLGGIGKGTVLSRGKRKRTERRERVTWKEEFVERELARLEAEAAKRAEHLAANKRTQPSFVKLGTLADALGEADAEARLHKKERPVQKVLHAKARMRLLEEETVQVNNVIEHPAFQADPMEALRQHLTNSIGEDPMSIPEALAPSSKKKLGKNGKAKASPAEVGVAARIGRPAETGRVGKPGSREVAVDRTRSKKQNVSKGNRLSSGRVAKKSVGRIGEKRPKI